MSREIEFKNWIDRTIEYVAPGFAARYMARTALASYRGAIRSRTSSGWDRSTSYKGGRQRDRISQGSMRDRARRAYSDNAIARTLLNSETDAVASDGYWVQFKSKDEAWNKEAETRFYKWLDKADVTGLAKGAELFRMTWREPRKDGDGLMLLITVGGYPRLQYIPGDLIHNPYSGYDFKTMKEGVEIDDSGRPVRFWIRDVDEAGKDTVTPVDARDAVYWAHRDDDPMSVRGTSVYATIFFILDQLDAYVDAVTKAAIMAAIFGLIEKRKNPAAALTALGTTPNAAGEQQKAVTLDRDGMLKVIGADDSIFQVQAQQPMSQTPDFIRALLRLAGLAFDMPLEMGMKDFSQVNFSGGQLGMKAFEMSCRNKQTWHMGGWQQIVFWWASVERRRQQLGFDDAFKEPFPEDYGEFEINASEWLLRDRMGEAQADLLEQTIGASIPQRACRRRSIDYRQNLAERQTAWADNEAAKLPNVLSTASRDAKLTVTSVDANGNPVEGGAQSGFNGAEVIAALEVLAKVRDKAISAEAALPLLQGMGIDAAQAKAAIDKTPLLGDGGQDIEFMREIGKALLAVPAAREAMYNKIGVDGLVKIVGLPVEPDYNVPFIPVIAPAGRLVSGAEISDPEGDTVGGDVENNVPANLGDGSDAAADPGSSNAAADAPGVEEVQNAPPGEAKSDAPPAPAAGSD